MSEEFADAGAQGVSPLRKKISAVLLILLLVVLGIELRAIAGQTWSIQSLQAVAPEGGFGTRSNTHSDVLEMLSFAPTESIERETDDHVEYKYSWNSLLRPLLGKPESALYVVFQKDNKDEQWARFYSTDAMSDSERAAADLANQLASQTGDMSTPLDSDGAMAGGMPPGGGGGQGRGNRPEGGPDSGRGTPPTDPTVSLLDTDKDGTLSAEELEAAAAALLAGDTNGDGKLSGEELRPALASGGLEDNPPARQRPPMDEETGEDKEESQAKNEDPDDNDTAVETNSKADADGSADNTKAPEKEKAEGPSADSDAPDKAAGESGSKAESSPDAPPTPDNASGDESDPAKSEE